MIGTSKRFRIAIVGYGAAGAASALLLSRNGHDVTVFEQSSDVKPVGAGVLLQPSGQMALTVMGLLQSVIANAEPIERLIAFKRSGALLNDLPYSELGADCQAYGLHRADLFDVLHPAVQSAGAILKFNSRVTKTQTRPEEIVLFNENGESLGTFDFMLACDGVRSPLRNQSGIRQWGFDYSHGALWALGRSAAIKRRLHQNTVGSRTLYGLLPMGKGRCSLFVSMHKSEFPIWLKTPLDDWKRSVLRVCPLAEELLSSVSMHEELRFTTYRHVVMSTWFRGRTLFLGDAAHSFSPHTGQGLNMALIDACVFAACLREAGDFESACHSYSRARAQHVRFYAWLTLSLAPFFQSGVPLLGWGRDIALPLMQHVPWIRRQSVLAMSGLKGGFLSGRIPNLS